jgi:heterodisulfide reductase subunit C
MDNINLEQADTNFRNELAKQPGGEKISACFMCRACTATCPITKVNDKFNPFRIIRLALFGLKEEILTSDFIWLCSSCYACQERCPQGVNIPEFITFLKNLAVKEGYAPVGVRAQMNIIKGEGRIYPIDEFDNKKRNKSGLPSLPTSCEVVKDLFSEEKDSEGTNPEP